MSVQLWPCKRSQKLTKYYCLVYGNHSEPISGIEAIVTDENLAKEWVSWTEKNYNTDSCYYIKVDSGMLIQSGLLEEKRVTEQEWIEGNRGGRFCSVCLKFHNFPMCENK